MDGKEVFLRQVLERVRARLRKRNVQAIDRLEQVFRRNVTAFGYSARGLLEALEVPHRQYVSTDYLPGRVVVIDAQTDETELPSIEVINDLLARGGTVIVEGRALAVLSDQPRVLRVAKPFLPNTYPEQKGDEGSEKNAYTRAVDRWAKKYCDIAEAIANA